MDDLYADGGGAAAKWQRKHRARKLHEAALKARRLARQEEKLDLKKRTKKWRAKLNAQKAANKAAGLPPPSRHGRPRDMKRPQWIDMTGRRYGRLTVLRVAPVSKNGGQRCRRWWVQCDCGHAEHLVNGTCLRQGIARSCGCLKRELVRQCWKTGKLAKRQAEREREKAKPIPWQLLRLRRNFREGTKEAKLISKTRNLLIAYELKLGIRKPRKCWKTDRYTIPTIH